MPATQAIEAVNRTVALPADGLIAAASKLVADLSDRPEAAAAVRQILSEVRRVKRGIQEVGDDMARRPPGDAAALRGKRVLVIDADERVRKSAHAILERAGAVVEAAAGGREGLTLAAAGRYDAVLVAVKHPAGDLGGTAVYRRLVELQPAGRVILTQGFEYDGGHTVVNARLDGYWLPVLFKEPFQEPILFRALTTPPPAEANGKAAARAV